MATIAVKSEIKEPLNGDDSKAKKKMTASSPLCRSPTSPTFACHHRLAPSSPALVAELWMPDHSLRCLSWAHTMTLWCYVCRSTPAVHLSTHYSACYSAVYLEVYIFFLEVVKQPHDLSARASTISFSIILSCYYLLPLNLRRI